MIRSADGPIARRPRLVLLKPYAAADGAADGAHSLSQLAGGKPCVLHLFTG